MNDFPDMLPEWVRSSNPPVRSAPPAAKVRWLREFVRSNATFIALNDLYGFPGPTHCYGLPCELRGEVLVVAICAGMAAQIGESRDMGGLAGRAEWPDAQKRAARFAEDLRKAIWTLGRDRATGGEILARATSVNDRHDLALSDENLLDITRKIAVAAAVGRRQHVR
jgi:hypothetical protein